MTASPEDDSDADLEMFDAIVVGSGFGGAVAAARLAQAGQRVLVLERGRRWRPDEFPRRSRIEAGWLWQADQGLYDVRWLGKMVAVQAAGWGGGSLAYANVFARPYDRALDERWPRHLRRGVLDPYYDLAAHMLEVSPVAPDPATGRVPERTTLIEGILGEMAIAEAGFRPNLAVRFDDPEQWRDNIHGVPQRGCRFVGECIIGCRYSAKNSLDFNYLAVAERAGARAFADSEVRRIDAIDDGWRLAVRTPGDRKSADRTYRATRVFLAAGAVSTTELLLRARDVDGTLPDLSKRLGEDFSGNGDFLALSSGRGSADLSTGPTITTSTVLDVWERREAVWFQTQDGAYPFAVHALADQLLPLRRLRRWWRTARRIEPRNRFAVLSMGLDSAGGRLGLNRSGEAILRWSNRREARLIRAQERVGPALARMLGAPVRSAITWALFRRTVTVHPLGGVPVGQDAVTGVVDEWGRVHGYRDLFVVDGSVVPAATGVNPSATILAMAERTMEHVVRDITGDAGWSAPEWSEVKATPAPEDAAFAFMADRRARTRGDGVRFQERMIGRRATLMLRAEIESMDAFLESPLHPISLSGTLRRHENDVAVQGRLELFPDDRQGLMRYRLESEGEKISGTKVARGRVGLLYALTHLRAEFGVGDRDVLSMGFVETVRLVLSIRGVGFTRLRRLRAAAPFVRFFAGRSLDSLRAR